MSRHRERMVGRTGRAEDGRNTMRREGSRGHRRPWRRGATCGVWPAAGGCDAGRRGCWAGGSPIGRMRQWVMGRGASTTGRVGSAGHCECDGSRVRVLDSRVRGGTVEWGRVETGADAPVGVAQSGGGAAGRRAASARRAARGAAAAPAALGISTVAVPRKGRPRAVLHGRVVAEDTCVSEAW